MTEERLPSKFAFILHADVAGSTELVRQDEHVAHKRIQDTFRRFGEIIAKFHGHVRELRGDALLAEFDRASDAVTAALAFQADQSEYTAQLNDNILPTVRVGIAMGEVVIADNTITGDGVVLAQRLEQLAESGGVCIQDAAYQTIPRRLPFEYEDRGEQELKGFEDPIRVYAIALKSGASIPLPETRSATQGTTISWRTLGGVVVAALILVGGWMAWFQPWLVKEEPASIERMAFPLPDKPSIAVLPFANLGGNSEQEVFSDGLTNDIITDLSKFKHLFVIASNSTFSYKGRAVKVQQVAEELGVRYVLEGSFQKAGERLRINVQLIDATTGHHLWAERYDRDASDFFAIQEDILRTIVASLASQITEAEIRRALGKETNDLGAYDYYQRAWRLFFTFTKEGNNQTLELLEKAIALDPDYARAYGLLAWTHALNSSGRYSWGQDPERSRALTLEVARKAVQLAPDDYFTHWALGFASMVYGDSDRAEAEYDRALALNSSDATLLANMAELLYKTGRAEQAITQIKLAMRINPHHPDWYFWDLGLAQYIAEQYPEVLDTLNRMSNSSNGVRRTRAAVLVRLGRIEEAREVMSKFIETDIDMTLEEMEAFAWKDREGLHRWIADLRVAGLPEERPLSLPDKPSIAVLPFTNMSDDPSQEYFVDGMTEDLITDLAKIKSVFVIARNTMFTFKHKSVVVPEVARELGVKYVLEGSVRRVGDKVRINTQLIDGASGTHLWAERYDGSLADIFSLQDKVTGEIVAELKITLTPDEQQSRDRKGTNNPDAHDAYLRGWQLYRRYTQEDFVEAIPHFERAVEIDPDYGQAWAALASVYWISYRKYFAWTLIVNPNGAADFSSWLQTRQKAEDYLEQAMKHPTPLAHQVESQMSWDYRQFDKALSEAEQAMKLDSNDPEGHKAMAWALIFAGRAGEAVGAAETGLRLDPYYPAPYHSALGIAHLMMRQYTEAEAALTRALSLNPESKNLLLPLTVAFVHLDKQEKARGALKQFSDFFFIYRTPDIESYIEWWPFKREADIRFFGGGLIEAGLCCEEQLEAYIGRVRQGGTLE